MPIAECSDCGYRCSVRDDLRGRKIRCPECGAVVPVTDYVSATTQLAITIETVPVQAAPPTPRAEGFYVTEGRRRRGPLSRDQLEALLRWELITPDTPVTDTAGRTWRATDALNTAHSGQESESRAAEQNRESTTSGRMRSVTRSPESGRGQTQSSAPHRSGSQSLPAQNSAGHSTASKGVGSASHSAQRAQSPTAHRGRTSTSANQARRRFVPERPKVARRDAIWQISDDAFMSVLNDAVKMERTARALRRKQPVRRESCDELILSPASIAVRGGAFPTTYMVLCVLCLIQSLAFVTCHSVISAMFAKRLFVLSASVFVPFESQVAELSETGLVQAGVALAFLAIELGIPFWLLLKNGLVVLHWLLPFVIGGGIGLALDGDNASKMIEVLALMTSMMGLLHTCIGLRLVSLSNHPSVTVPGIIATILTGMGAIGIGVLGTHGMMYPDVLRIPPALAGDGPVTAGAVICVLLVVLPIPLYCLSLLAPEGDAVTQSYVKGLMAATVILSIVTLIGTMALVSPPRIAFLSIPIMLIPVTAIGVIVVLLPPLLWILQPLYVIRR